MILVMMPYSNDNEGVSVTETRSPPHTTTLQTDVDNPRTQSNIPTRKSNRTHKAPTYLKDYHCLTNISKQHIPSLSLHALFTNKHHITSDVLCADSQILLQNVCHDSEPLAYEEATVNPAWQAAIVDT